MKVLIADDDRITSALLTRWVSRWGYEPVPVASGTEALDALRSDPQIQICIVDWVMPGLSGPEVCQRVRDQRSEPYVYVVLLTSNKETHALVEGLRSGADDYMVKPCHPLELEMRLRVGKRLIELQQKLIAAREQLRFEATHDALTQVMNRRAMNDELEIQFQKCYDLEHPLSVVMLDVDHFKSINDIHGHHAGDVVLREVAARLRALLADAGAVARFGGEEFLMVLPNCDRNQAADFAEKARSALAEHPMRVGNFGIKATASFGVATTAQFARLTADVLVRAADAAMYRSKQAGRNCVTLAQPFEFRGPSMPASSKML